MFKREDILEFLTRLIKNSNSQNVEASKESIEKFAEYLSLTTMCDDNTLSAITSVYECFEELLVIYEKTGICDLRSIFYPEINETSKAVTTDVSAKVVENKSEKGNPTLTRKRKFTKPYQKKHYDRYIPTKHNYGSNYSSQKSSMDSSYNSSSYGSSCGSGESYGSSCGSGESYGSSC